MFAQLHSVFTCYLRTPSRPHCTAAAPAPALRNNTFVYPELIAHPAGAIKNLGPHVQGYAHKPGTLRHWKITCLFFSWVFFFFLSRKSNRHFPWADAVTSMRRGPLRNLWISKWCYIRAALIRAGLAKHTKTGYSAQHIPAEPPTSDDSIKHRTSLLLIPSFQSCFFYMLKRSDAGNRLLSATT